MNLVALAAPGSSAPPKPPKLKPERRLFLSPAPPGSEVDQAGENTGGMTNDHSGNDTQRQKAHSRKEVENAILLDQAFDPCLLRSLVR